MSASIEHVERVESQPEDLDLDAAFRDSHVGEVLDELKT